MRARRRARVIISAEKLRELYPSLENSTIVAIGLQTTDNTINITAERLIEKKTRFCLKMEKTFEHISEEEFAEAIGLKENVQIIDINIFGVEEDPRILIAVQSDELPAVEPGVLSPLLYSKDECDLVFKK